MPNPGMMVLLPLQKQHCHVEHQWQPSESKIGWPYYHQTVFFFSPRLDGLPLPPPPALGVKVLDSWKDQHSLRAARIKAALSECSPDQHEMV